MAVAEDGEIFAAERPDALHRLGRLEQVVQGRDLDPAGAAQRRVVYVLAGKRHGRRHHLRQAATNRDDRLVAGCRPGRGHELAPARDGLELDQDALGVGIFGQPVEDVGKIDIDRTAEVDGRRKTDALGLGVVEDRAGDCGRLGNQGDFPGQDGDRGNAGVEPDRRDDQATAARAEDADQVRARGIEDGLAGVGQLGAGQLVAQGRADDHRPRAPLAELGDDFRNVLGAGADDRQIGRLGAFLDPYARAEAETRPRHRCQIQHRPGKAGTIEVAAHHLGVAAGLAGLLDHGHRTGPEEGFEVADGHVSGAV